MPSTSLILKYTKIVPEAYPPTKGSVKAAGYDLKSAFDCSVPARGKALVDTGLKVELPEGCYGRIAPRSGLAVKNFIDVGGTCVGGVLGLFYYIFFFCVAGVVDEDYRGVVKVVLFNHSDTPFEIKSGDRIAQLICERIFYPDLEEVKVSFIKHRENMVKRFFFRILLKLREVRVDSVLLVPINLFLFCCKLVIIS